MDVMIALFRDTFQPPGGEMGYFGLFGDLGQLHTFTFEMLIFVEMLDLLIIRERKHFWNSKPSRFLILAIAGDLVLVFLISVLGLPGIVPITPTAALAVAGFSFMIAFLINDPIKVLLIRTLWQ